MKVVKHGSSISLHYEVKVDGKVFDTNFHQIPLDVVVGTGKVIKGVDDVLVGMKMQEEKSVVLEEDQAFGRIKPELILKLPKKMLPGKELKLGMGIHIKDKKGKILNGRIIELDDTHLTADFNHMLAGKTVDVKLKVEDIKD